MYEISETNNNNYKVTVEKYLDMAYQIDLLAQTCHDSSKAAGWYTDPKTGKTIQRNVPEMLMLQVSEIAEALEGFRKNVMDDKLLHRKMFMVELADLMIRTFDTAQYVHENFPGYESDSLGVCFAEKFHFNQNRDDHKLTNRAKEGGKAFNGIG